MGTRESGASREEIRAQAERLAADGTGVKLSGRQNVPGVAAPEPEVKLKSVNARRCWMSWGWI